MRKNETKARHTFALSYIFTFLRWLAISIGIGLVCGWVGGAFSIGIEHATHLRTEHGWLLYCLPLAGIAIAGLYRALRLPLTLGTDEILRTVRTQEPVTLKMAPAIFLSTILTHLTGGSAGREGAALQLGGSIGVAMSKAAGHKDDSRRICELCGMAALFSALFGTPLAATLFVIEIVEVGRINDRALLPCLVAALCAKLAALSIGAQAELFPLAAVGAEVGIRTLLQAGGIGIGCAIVATVFCRLMHLSGDVLRKAIPHDFLRIACGGVAVVVLSLLIGTREYLGGGMPVILQALQGSAAASAFLWKFAFTMLTLSSGFKGGEIVPSFFIGATFGCVLAPLLGLAPALGAALGMIGVFCGVTNAPLSSIMLSVELFSAAYLPLFGVTAAVSFALSGHTSLYHAQVFFEPKIGHKE